jgi:hypothetical protein
MNTLEDRLRAAARAAAGTVADDSAPPLSLTQPERRPGLPGRFPWMVPLAAAAAVIAVIAGSILAVGSRPPARPFPVTTSGLPAYFLEFLPQPPTALPVTTYSPPIPPQLRSHNTVGVVATATGKVVATATLPGTVTAIAASRDAFFAAVLSGNLARFYEIRLTAGHAGTTVTELRIPPVPPDDAPVAYLAASPSGAELAYATDATDGNFGGRNLFVASTTDGSQREWTLPGGDSQRSLDSLGPMGWLADGRTLAFNWSAPMYSNADVSLHLLDTAAPGRDLLAGRAVLPPVYAAQAFTNDTTLSPNGQVVVGVASGYRVSRSTQGSVVAFSTATGKPTVLFRASTSGDHKTICYSPPVWVSSTGGEVLVGCAFEVKATPPAAYAEYIVLVDHGHVAKLPWIDANPQLVMAFPPAAAGGMPAHRGS